MGTVDREHLCPVCGFDLGFRAWDCASPSDEICPCCGIQFGYTDASGGDAQRRKTIYLNWRAAWIAGGTVWDKRRSEPPPGWDPIPQLKRVGGDA